jgi:hypothetical protein
MIAGIVILTVILIKHITNSPTGSTTSTTTATKTVFVDNDPHRRYYYGFGTPNVNRYKAQYYN